VYFGKDAIRHQYDQFQKKEFEVSHGMDHSRKSLDQLGEVIDMTLREDGEKLRCYVISKWLKGTDNQNQAHILREQGRMKYISGGWSGMITFNREEGRFEIIKPVLREVSSTPTPAKRDAKVQNALEVILSLTQTPMEESIMEKDETQEIEPSPEGEEVVEQNAELTALKKEMQAEIEKTKLVRTEFEQAKTDMQAELANQKRASLLERAKEIGLSEATVTSFKDNTPEEIEMALKVATEVRMGVLSDRDPTIQLGGEDGAALVDGSPEMIAKLEKEFFDWGDLDDEELVI
jgi:hypothetical protein